jgi:hypothetical protein
LTAKHKNDTLAAIEHKCNAGGSSWKLMVQKWKGFTAPSKRVDAVQKGAQTKLITVAELKQVQAIAMMSPLRQLDSILLSMAGLSFLMSRGNRSEILPHLRFFGLNLRHHQKIDGTTRHLLGFALGARLKHDNGSLLKDLAVLQHRDPLLDTHGHLAFVDLGYNFLYGWAQGRDIPAHIACMVHGSVAAAHAAGVYRQLNPAVEAGSKPLQWLEYGFLARGKATEAKIAHVTSVLRGLLRESELKKSVSRNKITSIINGKKIAVPPLLPKITAMKFVREWASPVSQGSAVFSKNLWDEERKVASLPAHFPEYFPPLSNGHAARVTAWGSWALVLQLSCLKIVAASKSAPEAFDRSHRL